MAYAFSAPASCHLRFPICAVLRRAALFAKPQALASFAVPRTSSDTASRPLQPIKTPATMLPASEFCFSQTNSFSKENAALPEEIRCSGVDNRDRFGLLLSINFGCCLPRFGGRCICLIRAASFVSLLIPRFAESSAFHIATCKLLRSSGMRQYFTKSLPHLHYSQLSAPPV